MTGLDPNTIRQAISRTRDLLAARHPHTLTPASPRPDPALREYAARAGITIRRTRHGMNPHADHTKTRDTPETRLNLECLRGATVSPHTRNTT